MISGKRIGSLLLHGEQDYGTLSHPSLGSAHCLKKYFFKVLTKGSKDTDKNAPEEKLGDG